MFTVANYPVDATDANAVAAKEKALADGQQAAFRSLLKRIVPVTAYKQLSRLSQISRRPNWSSGVSVRSERNSSTQYIASLDFTLSGRGGARSSAVAWHPVRRRAGAPVTLVPVIRQGAAGRSQGRCGQLASAWKGLDLEHTLTPLKIEELKAAVHGDTIDMAANGDDNGLRILAGEYKTRERRARHRRTRTPPKKLNITLAGRDASGPITLKRSYRVPDGDFAYAGELAAVVSLGILEGRWKAHAYARRRRGLARRRCSGDGTRTRRARVRRSGAATPRRPRRTSSPRRAVRQLAQWNEMRTQLLETPGVENLEIAAVSGSQADVALQFPGGGRALANILGSRGLRMIDTGGGWALSSSY